MREPLVSYVIAAYNHEAYIPALLDSIANQTFGDIEIIIVDDGSIDRTLEIAHRAAASDPRMTVYSQQNSGVVAARNIGIKRSSAPYISIVDSDEILPLDRTEKMIQALEAIPQASLVYGDAEIRRLPKGTVSRFFEIYKPIGGSFSEALFCNYCFVPAGSVMFRRNAFERTGEFWGPGPNTDYLKWIELGMKGEAICLRNEILGTWVLHGENVSQGDAETRCAQYHALCLALIALTEKYPEFAGKIGKRRQYHRYSRCYMMAGFYAGRESKWALARKQFKAALSYERSFITLALWLSTLPGINYCSGIAYDLAAKQFLRETA
jgi:glycosyltransferase involved in cell wall biosynthesis